MGDYNKRQGGFGGNGGGFNRGGDRPRFGGGRPDFKRGGDRDDRPMFDATCASCGKSCKVPFRPNGEKPVYCNDCFRANQDAPAGDFGRRENRTETPRFQKRDFAPAFTPKPQGEDRRIDDLRIKLETMSTKLDKIMQIVSGSMQTGAVALKQQEKKADSASLKTVVANAVAPVMKIEKKSAKKKVVSKKK